MLNLNIIHSEQSTAGEDGSSVFSPSPLLIVLVTGMVMFGLIMLYSTSSGSTAADRHFMGITVPSDFLFFIKQSMWALIGTGAAIVIYALGIKRLTDMSGLMMLAAVGLLGAALFFPEFNGARRWIRVAGFSLQPSEFAKIAVIIYLSRMLVKKQRFMNSARSLLPMLAWVSAVIVLIIAGEDLGTTVLLASTVWIMFFVAGMRLRWLLLPPLILLPPLSVYIYYFDKMRMSRILSFLDPESVHGKIGYQLWKSLLALGSGNWTGLGFTHSRMKAMYLPAAHTDFILSIVGEELGFIAILTLILAYICIAVIGVWVSMRANNKTHLLLGIGAVSLISLQAFINLGVVSGALPTKGMPAPFISYGGSNMVMSLCCIGLLLCIEKERQMETEE